MLQIAANGNDPAIRFAPNHANPIVGKEKNSPLGAARQTYLELAPGPYAQSSSLAIGNGICIVDTGFQANSGLQIFYGINLSGVEVPMGLNLGAYSGLQLNFAGLASAEGLNVIIEIDPSSGGYYESVASLNTGVNAFSVGFPFSSFLRGGSGVPLTAAEVSDINYIVIIFDGTGSTDSFGITSFQAVN